MEHNLWSIVLPIVTFAVFGLWIWALVDAIASKNLTTGQRVFWVLLLVFFSFVGAVLYFSLAHVQQAANRKARS